MSGSDNRRTIRTECSFAVNRRAADDGLRLSRIRVQHLDRRRAGNRQKTPPVGTEANRPVVAVVGSQGPEQAPAFDGVYGQAASSDRQRSLVGSKLQVIEFTRGGVNSLKAAALVLVQDCNRSRAGARGDPPTAGAHSDRNDTEVGLTSSPGPQPESNARKTCGDDDCENGPPAHLKRHVFFRPGRCAICCNFRRGRGAFALP